MQPMTRSEQDKMVPIDTSGASVEIELENSKDKEVAVEEENTVVEEQPVEEPSQEEPQKQEPPELEEGQESKGKKLRKQINKQIRWETCWENRIKIHE